MTDEIDRWERDAVLMSGDLKRFTEWAIGKGLVFRNELQAQRVMHKLITATPSLDLEYRRKSKRWLHDRGLHGLDDGDI
ncbi:hypothetical protein I6F35_02645 [Bradyrhizobium sp. BRP22]|uniref:hypothetical protein n=1 Tax=Bradyrhizobium sp. BRP22 TaxID=2793821 RepID=UPI001CD57785|nr:hypothetical protein [Bradyrhizobium sp. BRP22]MCA1452112.1 hypothetical protein [Bradyrhizobium sp. BRP22]